MQSCVTTLFLFMAVNGAWASHGFPLPYFPLGWLPPSENFIYHPPPAFGDHPHFFDYPEFRSNFFDFYEPPSYAPSKWYGYYGHPQAPKYPAYSKYSPAPQKPYKPLVQYIHLQSPQRPIPSILQGPSPNYKPVIEIYNRLAEAPKPQQMQQPATVAAGSKSGGMMTMPVNSGSNSKPEEVKSSAASTDKAKPTEMANPMNSVDNSKPEKMTPNPMNSVPQSQPAKPTEAPMQNGAAKPSPPNVPQNPPQMMMMMQLVKIPTKLTTA